MVRRSFRLGLWAGLLLGVAAALVKTMQGRRDSKELNSPPSDRWAAAPPAATAAPVAAPFAPTAAPLTPRPAPPAPTPAPAAPTFAPPAPTAPIQADRWDSEPRPSDVTDAPDSRPVKSVPVGEAPATKPAAPPRKTVAAGKRVATAKRTPVVKATTWVRPVAGVCPPTHPVKGKLASRLFHLPGMFAYDRTRADRCYISEAAAVADGLARAKR